MKNVFIGGVVPFGAHPLRRLDFSNVTGNVFSSVKIGRETDKNVVCLQCTVNVIANKNYAWRLSLFLPFCAFK